MRPKFLVLVTSRFERELDVLLRRHRELADHYGFVLDVLKTDPYNQTRTHPIKKLTAVQTGKGQYRIRAERFRFRYDIG